MLIEFSRTLEVSESYQKISSKVDSFIEKQPKFSVHFDNDVVIVKSPLEFPELTWSWNLYIFFKDNISFAILFRPIDGNFELCGAPKDRGFPPKWFRKPKILECKN